MEYEKIENVVFVYVYVLGMDEPVLRRVYDEYDDAVKIVQQVALDGVGSFDHAIKRNVFYPAHRIDRCEYFRAKRLTERIEKSDSSVMPDIWHGHYEDLDGKKIYY